MSNSELTVIDTPEGIEAVRLLAIRAGLRIEIVTGMRNSRANLRLLANKAMGTSLRYRTATYRAFDAWLVQRYPGRVTSRPLPERKTP